MSDTRADRGSSYVHGGAWRDPQVTSKAILPTLKYLDPFKLGIAGIVSINYRLSPYPSHPTDPSKLDDETRNIQHPIHIEDILTGLEKILSIHNFGSNYILIGHSCGATLAFQTLMSKWESRSQGNSHISPPSAVIGLEGIYDTKLLLETHTHPAYREFIEAAFGTEEAQWKDASPTSGKYSTTWKEGRIVVLAHSSDDELVDWNQTERMSDVLWKEKRKERRDVVIKLKGKHDEIWQDGREVARAIEVAIGMLRRVGEGE